MTSWRIKQLPFSAIGLNGWQESDNKHTNWPVVYTLNNDKEVYIGETLSAVSRMQQHLMTPGKQQLIDTRIILDETFNKSVCLDLESFLIRLFSGDGQFTVKNLNAGITNADYFNRSRYQETFREIFQELWSQGLFTQSISSIENSDFFKYSPFKSLTTDQTFAIDNILKSLFEDLKNSQQYSLVVEGAPGTGKTILAVFLIKLLVDIQTANKDDYLEVESLFSDYFVEGYPELLKDFEVAIVIPQQSLRTTIQKVFAKTSGLTKQMVMNPYELAESKTHYDIVIVDEAHRLNQRANQSSAALNKKFTAINTQLFGNDNPEHTQLDWIKAKSNHQILLIDTLQSVKPADLPRKVLEKLLSDAKSHHKHFMLMTQMRVKAGSDYIGYIRSVLNGENPSKPEFGEYDLRFFDDPAIMHKEISARESETGLARMLAGYAWDWVSKGNHNVFDIQIGDYQRKWNSQAKDWVNSPNAIEEIGSIHTIQGYDLNYAGVIIGPDLKFDDRSNTIVFDRSNYFDKKGKENNPRLGISYSDEELFEFIKNIYGVLLTRGIRGTYVYVHDPKLREYLRPFLQ